MTTGRFNYQSDLVTKSLLSSGGVYLNRETTGFDEPPVGTEMVSIEVNIQNGREHPKTLDVNGFTMVDHVYDHIDYFDEDKILNEYYPICCRLIQEKTGASLVVAFDHNIRISETRVNEDNRIKGGNYVMTPAMIVHNDYTITSAPLRIRQLSSPLKQNDVLRKVLGDNPLINPDDVEKLLAGRYAFINVWRNISEHPVEDTPLGICDATTFSFDDLITFELRYVDRVGENYVSAYNPSHQWVYYPRITRDEAILLKVWDSRGEKVKKNTNVEDDITIPSSFSIHSAFVDPQSPPNCPKRESMEVRCIAFF